MTRTTLADKLFPEVNQTIEEMLIKYPERANKTALRFAPSPTGYLHFWGLFTSFVGRKYAKQLGGNFLLRIEDTDQKREIEGATQLLIKSLKKFWVQFDEGPLGEQGEEIGDYGPYMQSKRKAIYRIFAKELVKKGLAYPCWMSEEELNQIREMQTANKITPGIYGRYSAWREKSPAELSEKLEQEGGTFPVLRFRSPADMSKKISFTDLIRGEINMIDNYNDIVLIKGDGLPTYHLAHIVDDSLMRTSTITRGEEWLTSVPLHLQLFEAFDLPAPEYCHFAPVCTLDEGKKRKLSKRKDPEANVEFFFEQGYAPQSLLEYIMTLADSSYEDWQKEHLDQTFLDFDFSIKKMNVSGPIFDIVKLQSINNNYLSKISTAELYEQGLARAKEHNNELANLMKSDPTYTQEALNIERHTEKDPKRFTLYSDISKNISFFFDPKREEIKKEKADFPDHIPLETWKAFAQAYAEQFSLEGEVIDRFEQLKTIGKPFGFATNNAEFKEGGYIGKIGDLAMFLRIQLCGSKQTPDLFSVMKVLGRERITKRLTDFN